MVRQTITAVIPAKNEEKNIYRCIGSVNWCDKVIVMWMGDDKTGQIAKKLGAEVVGMNKSKTDNFVSVQKNINWAIDHCTTDWILRIDADEVVTPELKKEIVQLFNGPIVNNQAIEQSDNIVAYGIPRKQYFLGGFLKGGDWAYDRLVRLFRPKFASYEPLVPVHEQFKVNGEIGYLKNALLHFSHPTLKEVFSKFNSYTDVQIKDIHDNLFVAIFKMLFLPPYIFLRWNIWHLGIRDGWLGIVAGAFRGWYDFILYFKYIKMKLTHENS